MRVERTHTTKLKFAYRNFAKAPKSVQQERHIISSLTANETSAHAAQMIR
jgi:hypothetical protein